MKWLIVGGIIVLAIYSYFSELIGKHKSNQRKKELIEKFHQSPIADFNTAKETSIVRQLIRTADPQEIGRELIEKEAERRKLNLQYRHIDTRRRCKLCRHKMVLRVNTRTDNKFLGCSQYPHCKYTRGYRE